MIGVRRGELRQRALPARRVGTGRGEVKGESLGTGVARCARSGKAAIEELQPRNFEMVTLTIYEATKTCYRGNERQELPAEGGGARGWNYGDTALSHRAALCENAANLKFLFRRAVLVRIASTVRIGHLLRKRGRAIQCT